MTPEETARGGDDTPMTAEETACARPEGGKAMEAGEEGGTVEVKSHCVEKRVALSESMFEAPEPVPKVKEVPWSHKDSEGVSSGKVEAEKPPVVEEPKGPDAPVAKRRHPLKFEEVISEVVRCLPTKFEQICIW